MTKPLMASHTLPHTPSPILQLPDQVEKIAADLHDIIKQAGKIPRLDDGSFGQYQQICARIPVHIQSGRLKIAVVGTIKSGKSTLVNSFLKKDLVKRGAGAVTAIPTRIRKGKKDQANLYFKTWDEINLQLGNALQLFPDDRPIEDGTVMDRSQTCSRPFDIRRKKDRTYLEKVYLTLKTQFPDSTRGIRPESLLIHHALNGFNACKDLVGADETCHCFESNQFDDHKKFTADPDRAFYVKDVCLELSGKMIDPNIEITDCQGADSTDPSQLAQVLTYIETANLIIYCISSRTGLRQADMILLNRIKRLGLLEQIVFVNNCDLSEHENIEDLVKIQANMLQDLSFLNIQPRMFSFSSLYNLFTHLKPTLNDRDLARLTLWSKESAMVRQCDEQTRQFNAAFTQMIDQDRHRFLILNHLNRLGAIVKKMDSQASVVLDLLSCDQVKEKQAIERIDALVQNAARLETIVSSSMEGAIKGLKEQTASDIRQFFKTDGADILKQTQAFIAGIAIDVDGYRANVKQTGFKQILYLMFQDFKRQLDLYGLEYITPALKKYVRKREDQIHEYFKSLFYSYQIDLNLSGHGAKAEKSAETNTSYDHMDIVDLENIKRLTGLKFPEHLFEASYSPALKANVFSGFFFRTIFEIAAIVFKQKSQFSFSPVLEQMAGKIKKENQKIIRQQFFQFSEKLYVRYFLPLIEAAFRDFKDKIDQQFNRYQSLKQEKQDFFTLNQTEKENQRQLVLSIQEQITMIRRDIALIGNQTNTAVEGLNHEH
ncbi:MAG: dynamin family protein [Pseudomonadota bacterium]